MVLRGLCSDVIDNNNVNMDELNSEKDSIIQRKENVESEIQQEKVKLSNF
jgi:hypothetical protein